MIFNRIIFWEPVLSPHKVDFFNALQKLNPQTKIICCACMDLDSDRIAQGWMIQENLSFEFLLISNRDKIKSLILEDIEHTLHILSGIRWFRNIINAIFFIKKYNLPFAIMSEPRVLDDCLGPIRFLQSRFFEGWFRKNTSLVFAIGVNGPKWFDLVGYKTGSTLPFAYFVNPPITINFTSNSSLLKVGYVGRLIEMKGVRYLLEAMYLIKDKVSIEFVGIGNLYKKLQSKSTALGINSTFHGVLPMNKVGEFMSSLDVLVLPSISDDDGWGVVISEALMCGVAVIATDAVGSSILLDDPRLGLCIERKSPNAIVEAILKLKRNNLFSVNARLVRKNIAISRLSAQYGATYFYSIIEWKFNDGIKPSHFPK